jgi:hypothetical protein
MNSDADWKDVLVGKKIVQGSNVDEKTVRTSRFHVISMLIMKLIVTTMQSFSINALPPGTRVLKPDSMKTMDYRSDRCISRRCRHIVCLTSFL